MAQTNFLPTRRRVMLILSLTEMEVLARLMEALPQEFPVGRLAATEQRVRKAITEGLEHATEQTKPSPHG